jgi:hypothetical protein
MIFLAKPTEFTNSIWLSPGQPGPPAETASQNASKFRPQISLTFRANDFTAEVKEVLVGLNRFEIQSKYLQFSSIIRLSGSGRPQPITPAQDVAIEKMSRPEQKCCCGPKAAHRISEEFAQS